MKEEILAAVMFFIRFIEKSESFPREQLENFKRHLTELLMERFEKHWFPELPTRGQGYRCIRINGVSPTDLCLELAASKCGLSYTDLKLPTELTVWVDPSEVCYRLGESEGSYCTLATFPLSSDGSSFYSSESSASSSPVPSPPSTPTQEKVAAAARRMLFNANKSNNSKYSIDLMHAKFRNHTAATAQPPPPPTAAQNGAVPAPALRPKNSPRDIHYFNPNRPMYRCDGPPYPLTPAFYRNMNYNRNHYKNVLRV